MTYSQIIAFLVFLTPLAYSPGPGNLSFAAASAANGIKATLNANFGYHIATIILTLVIGFGFDQILRDNPQILKYIGIVGSLYIVYLGVKFLRSGFNKMELKNTNINFYDGWMLLFLNPKGYLIIFLMFTQFKADSSQNNVVFILVITAIFTLNNFIAFTIWSYAGVGITKMLRNEKAQRRMNIVFGILLILVAIKLNF